MNGAIPLLCLYLFLAWRRNFKFFIVKILAWMGIFEKDMLK